MRDWCRVAEPTPTPLLKRVTAKLG